MQFLCHFFNLIFKTLQYPQLKFLNEFQNSKIPYFGLKFLSFKNYISGNDFPISHEPLDQNAKPGCKFKGSDVDTAH